MYCPHCGREIRLVEGMYVCEAGEMTFGQYLHGILAKIFPEQRPRTIEVEVGRQLTRWFCPGCGVPLGKGMVCGQCGQSIHDLLWQLVELHPHAQG
jgi:hypothetical protein